MSRNFSSVYDILDIAPQEEEQDVMSRERGGLAYVGPCRTQSNGSECLVQKLKDYEA